MSDMLMLTLALLGSVMACLAKPCGPEYWALVKPARSAVPEPSLDVPANSTRRLKRHRKPEDVAGWAEELARAAG